MTDFDYVSTDYKYGVKVFSGSSDIKMHFPKDKTGNIDFSLVSESYSSPNFKDNPALVKLHTFLDKTLNITFLSPKNAYDFATSKDGLKKILAKEPYFRSIYFYEASDYDDAITISQDYHDDWSWVGFLVGDKYAFDSDNEFEQSTNDLLLQIHNFVDNNWATIEVYDYNSGKFIASTPDISTSEYDFEVSTNMKNWVKVNYYIRRYISSDKIKNAMFFAPQTTDTINSFIDVFLDK